MKATWWQAKLINSTSHLKAGGTVDATRTTDEFAAGDPEEEMSDEEEMRSVHSDSDDED